MNFQQIEKIMTSIGFSPYESRAYASLVNKHPQTGYELSKWSGVPRSKIYECLERLIRKNLVLTIDGSPLRYVPVPPKELVRRLSDDFESSLTALGTLLEENSETKDIDYIYNISGYDDIIAKAVLIVQTSNQILDLSLWKPEIEVLEEHLRSAFERGVRIRLLSFNSISYDWAEVYHHRPLEEQKSSGRWITVIKDNEEVLTGQCAGEGGIVAAWTRNKSLVFISMKYIEHEIIKITKFNG
jgi:HTH-type transcriptional regulator, sugar sensing transcriptional regulator